MIGDWEKLAIAAVASLVVHATVAAGLDQLPPQPPIAMSRPITVSVVEPPRQAVKEPEPEPAKPPEPKPDEPKPKPKPLDKPVPHEPSHEQAPKPATPPVTTPPPDHAPTTTDTGDEPVFGVNMESTSQGGKGPEMQVGNTTRPQPSQGSAAPKEAPKQLAEPVPDYEVSTPPLPQGRCTGKYTDDARAAGVEGVVVLDVIVGEDGRVRDVTVVQKLGHGLDEAAVAALRACRFSPGEQGGRAVPVRIKQFKIHFVLSEP